MMTEADKPTILTPTEILHQYQLVQQEMLSASPEVLALLSQRYQVLQEIIDKARSSSYGSK